jgi:hypothetical protein
MKTGGLGDSSNLGEFVVDIFTNPLTYRQVSRANAKRTDVLRIWGRFVQQESDVNFRTLRIRIGNGSLP